MTRPANPKNSIETVVTFLEMGNEPHHRIPAPAQVKLMLVKAENCSVRFYRYLYESVGNEHHWVDRKAMSDTALSALIHAPNTEIFVLYVGGVPAGFFEIEAGGESVEIKYFGLASEFRGRGLGKWLLAEAIRVCWSHKPSKVRVETCTLDSPSALPLYQRMGFQPYARKHRMVRTSPAPRKKKRKIATI